MNAPASIPARTERAGGRVWTGRVLTGLIVAFLLVDAFGKLVPLAIHVEGTQSLGFSVDHVRPLGVVLAVATALHVVPRTQFLGAVLLTAYLGGATAVHVLTGSPFWFAVTMGVLLWIGYALRSPRLRDLVRKAD